MADTTTQPDNTGGSMLALYPPSRAAKALTVPGGLPRGEIHLTVAYTGKSADVDPEALNAVARTLACRDPLTVTISGAARFTGGDTDVAVALADSPALEDLRRDALDRLAAHGISVPREHGYTSHLSRAYMAPDAPDPCGRLAAFPVTFAAISAVHGKTRTDYDFGTELTEPPVAVAAREAFAAGYRMTGAPVTARARAAFRAALATACLFEGDPDVIAHTVRLGHLEGMRALEEQRRRELASRHLPVIADAWKTCAHSQAARRLVTRCMTDSCWDTAAATRTGPVTEGPDKFPAPGDTGTRRHPALDLTNLHGTWAEVYRRREALTADHAAKVTVIWQRMIKRLKPRKFARSYRRTLIDAPAEARREGPDAWRKDEARAALLGWLYGIFRDPQWAGLEQAIITAIIAAAAEGQAAALAVAADQAAAAGFNWDKAYAAMLVVVSDLDRLPGLADPYIEQILAAAAAGAARAIDTLGPDATEEEIVQAILDEITGPDARAVPAVIDQAIAQAMAQAALDLYLSEGILIIFMDAGDGRVCPACEQAADGSPYLPSDVPAIPQHNFCRCCYAPGQPLPLSAYADFLVPVG